MFSSESSGGTFCSEWSESFSSSARWHSVPGWSLDALLPAFDCAGIERLSVLQPNLALLWCLTGS